MEDADLDTLKHVGLLVLGGILLTIILIVAAHIISGQGQHLSQATSPLINNPSPVV